MTNTEDTLPKEPVSPDLPDQAKPPFEVIPGMGAMKEWPNGLRTRRKAKPRQRRSLR